MKEQISTATFYTNQHEQPLKKIVNFQETSDFQQTSSRKSTKRKRSKKSQRNSSRSQEAETPKKMDQSRAEEQCTQIVDELAQTSDPIEKKRLLRTLIESQRGKFGDPKDWKVLDDNAMGLFTSQSNSLNQQWNEKISTNIGPLENKDGMKWEIFSISCPRGQEAIEQLRKKFTFLLENGIWSDYEIESARNLLTRWLDCKDINAKERLMAWISKAGRARMVNGDDLYHIRSKSMEYANAMTKVHTHPGMNTDKERWVGNSRYHTLTHGLDSCHYKRKYNQDRVHTYISKSYAKLRNDIKEKDKRKIEKINERQHQVEYCERNNQLWRNVKTKTCVLSKPWGVNNKHLEKEKQLEQLQREVGTGAKSVERHNNYLTEKERLNIKKGPGVSKWYQKEKKYKYLEFPQKTREKSVVKKSDQTGTFDENGEKKRFVDESEFLFIEHKKNCHDHKYKDPNFEDLKVQKLVKKQKRTNIKIEKSKKQEKIDQVNKRRQALAMNEEARKRNLSKSKKQKLQVKKDYQFDCNISFDCFDELKKQPARSKSGVRVQLHKEELLKEQVADYQQIRQKQVRLESAITVQDNYTRDDFEVQHIQQAHDNQIHIPVGDLKQYEKFQSDLVIIPNINQNPVQNQQEDFIQEHNIIVENEESEDFIEGEHAHIEKRQIKRTQLLEAEKDMLKQINSTVQEGIVNYKQCIHYEQNYHNEKFQEHNKGHSVNVQYQSSGGGNMMINDGYVGKGLDGHIAKGFEKKYT